MTDQPNLSQRAEARAKAKARRAKRIQRRQAFLDLVASGYSHRQIAAAMGVGLATVRREVDKALAERPLHAPERHASLQVARLSRALCHADFKLARGDIRAFAPYMKLVAALDRYYGLEGRRLPRAAQTASVLALPQPPLALTHAAEPVLSPLPSEVAQTGAQDVEIAHGPRDIAGSAACARDPPLALAAEPVQPPLPSEVARFGAQDVETAGAAIDIAQLVG